MTDFVSTTKLHFDVGLALEDRAETTNFNKCKMWAYLYAFFRAGLFLFKK